MNCLKTIHSVALNYLTGVQVRFGAQEDNVVQWHPADVHLLLSELSPAREKAPVS